MLLANVALLCGQSAFSSRTDLVVAYAFVRDANDRVATNLTKEDFEVIEDGERREITAFAGDAGPLSIAILVNTETILAERMSAMYQATRTFSASLGADDFAGISNLSRPARLVSRNRGDLLLGLLSIPSLDGRLPLWDGLDRAIGTLGRETNRRAVLVLSGEPDDDRGPMVSLDENYYPSPPRKQARPIKTPNDVARRVEREGIAVYSLSEAGTKADGRLKDLAWSSGGAAVTALKDVPIGNVLAELVDEMHHLYLLGFAPAKSDGKEHRFQIRVRAPGTVVRARQTYVAPKLK